VVVAGFQSVSVVDVHAVYRVSGPFGLYNGAGSYSRHTSTQVNGIVQNVVVQVAETGRVIAVSEARCQPNAVNRLGQGSNSVGLSDLATSSCRP
jgi:hypothetical protein